MGTHRARRADARNRTPGGGHRCAAQSPAAREGCALLAAGRELPCVDVGSRRARSESTPMRETRIAGALGRARATSHEQPESASASKPRAKPEGIRTTRRREAAPEPYLAQIAIARSMPRTTARRSSCSRFALAAITIGPLTGAKPGPRSGPRSAVSAEPAGASGREPAKHAIRRGHVPAPDRPMTRVAFRRLTIDCVVASSTLSSRRAASAREAPTTIGDLKPAKSRSPDRK